VAKVIKFPPLIQVKICNCENFPPPLLVMAVVPATPGRTCIFCVQATRLTSLSIRGYRNQKEFEPALKKSPLPSLEKLGMTSNLNWKRKRTGKITEYHNLINYELARTLHVGGALTDREVCEDS
jgi:hypothetical protein